MLFLVILMLRGHLVLTTHFYRWGAQERWSEEQNRTGIKFVWPSLVFHLLKSSFSTFPHSYLLWQQYWLLVTYWIRPICFVSLTFTLMLKLATPKCILQPSLGSPVPSLLSYIHATWYMTQAMSVCRRDRWRKEGGEGGRKEGVHLIFVWIVWKWHLFSPSRQTSLSV